MINKGACIEYYGLSTDNKNNIKDLHAIFHEIDTGKVWVKDQPELPTGYQKCKYLKNEKTQWIDLGYYVSYYTGAVVTYKLDDHNNENCGVFGLLTDPKGTPDENRFQLYGLTENLTIGLGEDRYTYARDNEIHTVAIDNGNIRVYLDGVEVTMATHSKCKDDFHPMYLFASNHEGTAPPKPNNTRIYNFRIWEGKTLTMELIPCLDDSGVPCMYDTVTGKSFYNSGTDEFLYELEDTFWYDITSVY